jgi:LPXTG-motif cell wall-anchored protein
MPARYSRDGYSVGDYVYSGDEYWVDLAIDDILEITFINRYRRPYSPPPDDPEPPKIVVDEEPEAEPEEEEEIEIIEEIPEEVSIGDEVIDIVTDTPAVTEEELPKTGADILLALLGMALAGSGIAARRKRKR